MIFKIKKKPNKYGSPKTNNIDYIYDYRLRILEEETYQLVSDRNFGVISEEEYEIHRQDLEKKIAKFKEDYFNRTFDNLMGNPMDSITRFFSNE